MSEQSSNNASGRTRIELAGSAGSAALIAEVFDAVWHVRSMVAPEIITATLHNGGYGALAYIDDEIVGASFAIVGRSLAGQSGPNLHSHATGVVESAVGVGVGAALKMHQRQWARENGFSTITWTFDPLVRRNAHFNIVKLGAVVLGYHHNFYGELNDGINAGEQSDRVVVRWDVAGIEYPASGSFVEPDDSLILIETPDDIEQLRKIDRSLSDGWRLTQRTQFDAAYGNGFSVVGLTNKFSYALQKKGSE